jgi:hypothetical protein
MRVYEKIGFISKKYFRPGGMAPSEWTRSVRAVRDTPVADYFAPSLNTTHRVAYRPLIAVSPFLLALSVSYFKRTHWRCGQLLVLATVPDRHFGSGSGSEPNRCQIGGPGCQHTRTVDSGTVRCKSPNPSGLGGLSAGRTAGPSVDLYNVLVFAVA